MSTGAITRFVITALDRVAATLGRVRTLPRHLETGQRGEEEAYFYLRAQGYVVIARNWRTPRRRGEIDLIAWDGATLCFVEVKTRTTRAVAPAEAAVDRDKQQELRGMARLYLRRFGPETPFRFDVVSVYLVPGEPGDVTLFKDAFLWRSMSSTGRRRW